MARRLEHDDTEVSSEDGSVKPLVHKLEIRSKRIFVMLEHRDGRENCWEVLSVRNTEKNLAYYQSLEKIH